MGRNEPKPSVRGLVKSNVQWVYTKQQVDELLKRETALHRSESEWGNVISRVFCEVIAMADVIEVIGVGVKLRAYLINHDKHEVLAGLVVEINELLKKQKQEDRTLLNNDDPFVIWLRTSVYDASAAALAVKDTLDRPEPECIEKCKALVRWVEINVPEMVERKSALTRYVHLGGQPSSDGLKALYSVAYRLRKGNDWKAIIKAIDDLIAAGDSSDEIQLIADLWAEKRYEQKRDQLRNMFPPEKPIRGI